MQIAIARMNLAERKEFLSWKDRVWETLKGPRLGELVVKTPRPPLPAEAAGLMAIVHGFFLMHLPDDEVLGLEAPVFDALYHYCKQRVQTS